MPQSKSSQRPVWRGSEPSRSQEADRFMEGARAKSTAVLLGVVGFFFLGIIFGPLAIMQARKAEKYYGPATFAKVLGWIDTLIGLFWTWVLVGFLNGSGHLN